MTFSLAFFVHGKPEPGGSKRGFLVNGHVNIVDANPKVRAWKEKVRAHAGRAMLEAGLEPIDAPVALWCTFWMRRPKSHFKKDGSIRPDAPVLHSMKPDGLKLRRPVEDAMSGVVYRDDARVAKGYEEKLYDTGNLEGVSVVVRGLP